MASFILVVCIFHVTQLCHFMVYFTVKYVNILAHAHYYPCNRYHAFIFRASVCPYVSLHICEKLGLEMRLRLAVLITRRQVPPLLHASYTTGEQSHMLYFSGDPVTNYVNHMEVRLVVM